MRPKNEKLIKRIITAQSVTQIEGILKQFNIPDDQRESVLSEALEDQRVAFGSPIAQTLGAMLV